jgi:hypothetical protein
MPLKISIWDDRGPNFDDALLAEVTFEAIEIFQSAGHVKSETLPSGAVYVFLACIAEIWGSQADSCAASDRLEL